MIAAPGHAWRVFTQGEVPRVAFHEWSHNAKQFFDTSLELAEVEGTAARVAIASTKRVVFGRLREEQDLRDALAADKGGGLFDLAERRCGIVWLVEREGAEDRSALLLAATIASVGLGPILGDDRLFGVRTARELIQSRA